jgi:aminopeptidase-like protein
MPDQLCLLWVLNLADGKNSILDIAVRSKKSFRAILSAIELLQEADLLKLYSDKQQNAFSP